MRVYLKSPYLIKRVLFNLEAIRRNIYRRSGKYKSLSRSLDFQTLIDNNETVAFGRLNELLHYANNHVEFYRGNFKDIRINSYEELTNLPILSKQHVREHREMLISDEYPSNNAWDGSTSGSTGSPLKYYKDAESVMYNQILYDKYYEYVGCNVKKRKIRLSGIKILPYETVKPPFWVYVDFFKQLQCSVYHIGKNTYSQYVDKFRKFNAEFATGLSSAWTALAKCMIEENEKAVGLRAIVTDSEGLNDADRLEIERAFHCPVYRTYGLGEVGMFAVECKNHHYHIILYTHIAEVIDVNGQQVQDGEIGEIVVTDLFSKRCPYIRYRTGDLGVMSHKDCGCGIKTPYFTEIVGRIEDYILTKDGRRFGRVSLIVKKAKNIKQSQIIQISKDKIIIRVVPDKGFNPDHMGAVIDDAHMFVGDMTVEWEAVDQLERMPSGKVKFLIRREGVC